MNDDDRDGSDGGKTGCDEENVGPGLNAGSDPADTATQGSTVNSKNTATEGAGSMNEENDQDLEADKLNLLQVLGSVLAAGLGVQSSKNRERDFKQGRAGTFILAGLIFTALFIGSVYTVVSIVLSNR